MYVYVYREYCLQLILYSVSAQGVVEHNINVRFYYHYHVKKKLNQLVLKFLRRFAYLLIKDNIKSVQKFTDVCGVVLQLSMALQAFPNVL